MKKNINDRKTLQRNPFLDFTRGIAIFLVLWGHLIQYCGNGDFYTDKVFIVIYSFHMPLFMVLSGYVFHWSCHKKTPKKVIQGRIIGIGTPLVSWGIVSWIITMIFEHPKTIRDAVSSLFVEIKSIWFLWSVLFISIIVALIHTFKVKKLYKVLLYTVGGILLLILPNGHLNIFMYPFFLLGYFYNQCKDRVSGYIYRGKQKYVLIMIYIIGVCFYQKRDFIYVSGMNPFRSPFGFWIQIWIDFYRYIMGVLGVIAVLLLLKFVYERLLNSRAISWVEKVGQTSLQIYVMQRVIVEILGVRIYGWVCNRLFGGNILAENRILFDGIFTPVCAVCICAMIMIVVKYIEKNNKIRKVLFGR